jgi:hypothetical protein
MAENNWRFVYVTDMQPGSPKSYRFKPAFLENWQTARKQIMALEPEFMLIGGDITRDGTLHRWEFEEMKRDFESMGIPFYAVPGNMDVGNKVTTVEGPHPERRDTEIGITSELLRQYESVFGPSAWSVTHKNVRVSGFCDMLLGSGLPEEQDLKAWLEAQRAEQAENPRDEHRIWIMHYALFADAPDEPQWDIRTQEEYIAWYFTVDYDHRDWLFRLFRDTHTERVITGHIHCRKDHVADGIHFDLAPGTAFSQWDNRWPDGDPTLGFYRFDVDEDGMHRTFVPLERVSTRTDGYGPGGHPTPEMRDYSQAWER